MKSLLRVASSCNLFRCVWATRLLTPLLLILVAPASPLRAQSLQPFGVTTRTPPALHTTPSPKYWPRLRMWQGIPGIERSQGGRLWATWYTGPLSEGSEGNYCVLVTSGDDGRTWSQPVAVFDPVSFGGGNTGDPHLWVDPAGRLWWFLNRALDVGDPDGPRSIWAFCADDAEKAEPTWKEPVFVGRGVSLNKPIVLTGGDWMVPVDLFTKDPLRTQFYVSRDQGRSYAFLSKAPIENVSFSEHMILERRDGSLVTLARTTYGIGQIESHDRGETWTNDHAFTRERNINTRFFVRRLASGRWLLVVNDHPKQRTRMTAMLSEDEGKTWPYALLLDDRANVSYPDGTEAADGTLYLCYDRGRYHKDQQEILFAKITQEDIKAGRLVDPRSRLRQSINRLADFGGGVRVDREPQEMESEFLKMRELPQAIDGRRQKEISKP